MNSENAIEVRNVKKRFKVYMDKGNSMKEKVLFRSRNRYEERWVLKGVSFDVKKGEAIGLIGKNGCGKSTTLKMLTRIMYPTEGTIELTGRVSSLIELGAGFHPDMSGRENIFTNASIFGLNHTEIERRLDDIIKFSELEEFIDNPVRTYSSGMYMRLAFAVAINVDADILLIDEILAVGDVSFQAKCFEKLKEIKRSGTTIVIVSHVSQQIKNICDRAIWIDEGLIREEGRPDIVTEHYLGTMEERRMEKIESEFQEELRKREEGEKEEEKKETRKEEERKEGEEKVKTTEKEEIEIMSQDLEESFPKGDSEKNVQEKKMQIPKFCDKNAIRRGSLDVEIVNFQVLNMKNEEKAVFSTGESISFVIQYDCKLDKAEVDFRLGIARDDGVHCYGISSYSENGETISIHGKGKAILKLERNILLSGKYFVDIGIKTKDQEAYDVITGVRAIQIKDKGEFESGIVKMHHTWCFDC